MDYTYLESLVKSSKNGDKDAKAKIIEEFLPYINSTASKTFIKGYTTEDIKNHCIVILLQSIEKYHIEQCRFVSYGVKAIKNSINYLIRSELNHYQFSSEALTSEGSLDNLSINDYKDGEYIICRNEKIKRINKIISDLNKQELDILNFVFIRKNDIKSYADKCNIPYSTAAFRCQKLKEKFAIKGL